MKTRSKSYTKSRVEKNKSLIQSTKKSENVNDQVALKNCYVSLELLHLSVFNNIPLISTSTVHLLPESKNKVKMKPKSKSTSTYASADAGRLQKRPVYLAGLVIGYQYIDPETPVGEMESETATKSDNFQTMREKEGDEMKMDFPTLKEVGGEKLDNTTNLAKAGKPSSTLKKIKSEFKDVGSEQLSDDKCCNGFPLKESESTGTKAVEDRNNNYKALLPSKEGPNKNKAKCCHHRTLASMKTENKEGDDDTISIGDVKLELLEPQSQSSYVFGVPTPPSSKHDSFVSGEKIGESLESGTRNNLLDPVSTKLCDDSSKKTGTTEDELNPTVKLIRMDLKQSKSRPSQPEEEVEAVAVSQSEPEYESTNRQIKHKFCNICGKCVSSTDELHSFFELNEATLKRFVCLTCHKRCAPSERPRHKAGCFLVHDDVYYEGWEEDSKTRKLEKFRMLACQNCVDVAKQT